MPNQPRIPPFCPPGFLGRFTVRRGDTMFMLAQFFRVTVQELTSVNPHIPNPDIIYPGDVLCVPGLIPFPCCIVLHPRGSIIFGTFGAALAYVSSQGTNTVSIAASLPEPSTLGDFNTYVSKVTIPNVAEFSTELIPTPTEPPTWSATIGLPTAARLTPDTTVSADLHNTTSGISGPTVLFGTLNRCR